jgi:vancomycin resistance protein VanW
MSIKALARKLFPPTLRLRWKLWQRAVKDKRQSFHFATDKYSESVAAIFPFSLTETQPILYSATLENKLHNLCLGAAQIQDIIIAPNEVFSFWKLVGNPSAKNGFTKSRSIINGKLEAETGGGLCQLSGIIYLLALKAGLQILERHHHSIDIYKEAERFTPLGADATVAYGYKDLRLLNHLPQSICFSFLVEPHQITATLHSQQALYAKPVSFDYEDYNNSIEVKTCCDGVVLFTNQYKKLHTKR